MKADSFPALFAALTPETTPDGDRGFRVTCTATRALLGFVWWTCAGSVVTWHYCSADGEVGERTTKRNAVQALRDLTNGDWIPDDEPAPSARPPARRVFALGAGDTSGATDPAPTRPERRVAFDTDQMTAAIAAAFARRAK